MLVKSYYNKLIVFFKKNIAIIILCFFSTSCFNSEQEISSKIERPTSKTKIYMSRQELDDYAKSNPRVNEIRIKFGDNIGYTSFDPITQKKSLSLLYLYDDAIKNKINSSKYGVGIEFIFFDNVLLNWYIIRDIQSNVYYTFDSLKAKLRNGDSVHRVVDVLGEPPMVERQGNKMTFCYSFNEKISVNYPKSEYDLIQITITFFDDKILTIGYTGGIIEQGTNNIPILKIDVLSDNSPAAQVPIP